MLFPTSTSRSRRASPSPWSSASRSTSSAMRTSPTQLGDHRPRALGRVSLNPARHIDPIGALVFLVAGFGWGKPVPVNIGALRPGRIGMAIVSAAGPIANVVVAVVAGDPLPRARHRGRRGFALDGRRADRLLQPAARDLQPHPDPAARRLQRRPRLPAAAERRSWSSATRRTASSSSCCSSSCRTARSAAAGPGPAVHRGADRCIGSGSSSPTCGRASTRRRRPWSSASCRHRRRPVRGDAGRRSSAWARRRAAPRWRPGTTIPTCSAPRCSTTPARASDAALAPRRRRPARGVRAAALCAGWPARPALVAPPVPPLPPSTPRCRPRWPSARGCEPARGAFIRGQAARDRCAAAGGAEGCR